MRDLVCGSAQRASQCAGAFTRERLQECGVLGACGCTGHTALAFSYPRRITCVLYCRFHDRPDILVSRDSSCRARARSIIRERRPEINSYDRRFAYRANRRALTRAIYTLISRSTRRRRRRNEARSSLRRCARARAHVTPVNADEIP